MGAQIANSNPLVSDRQDLSVLQREYAEEDTVYQLKIKVRLTTLRSVITTPISLISSHVQQLRRLLHSLIPSEFFLCFAGFVQKILIHS